MKVWTQNELERARSEGQRAYVEFLREPSMSAGLYVLAAAAVDRQSPHAEDEVYIVLAGRAQFTAGDQTRTVGVGDVIFVPARLPHRFHGIVEELRLAVVFSPPESPPASAPESST